MIESIFLHQKQYSLELRKEPLETRLNALKDLGQAIEENIELITEALQQDFAKPPAETLLTEIYPVLKEIEHTRKNLKKWLRPKRVPAPLGLWGTKNFLIKDPRGVCLIISPWNYPFNLSLAPLISAIAGGNCAILKPSEWTPHTNAVLKKIITKIFAPEYITLLEGDLTLTKELLQQPFDHIFFTGSTQVGKIIMEAASKNLSSVTLELGGKSPVIIDSSADLKDAAEKIVWAKFLNAGQTCVAPDYALIHEDVLPQFKDLLIAQIQKSYGATKEAQKSSPDFARIISEKHCTRLYELLNEAVSLKAQVSCGGECDITARYFAPTLLENVDLSAKIMKEEIFGPLLPLIPFKDFAQAVHFINQRPKPLALYLYSHSSLNIQSTLLETSSGGVCLNDSVVHLGNEYLPFGGVGESGQGRYHGFFGFQTFTHEKAVLKRSRGRRALSWTHPPYTLSKLKILLQLIRWRI